MQKSLNRFTLAVLTGALCFAIMPHAQGALIQADFDHGGSDASPNTTDIDAYPGTVGGGWTSAWNKPGSAGTKTAAVVNTSPFGIGGNYLTLNVSGNANQDGFVQRSYGSPVDLTERHIVSFDYRLQADAFSTGQDIVQLWDVASGVSWYIIAYGDRNNWQVYNGDRADGGFTFSRVLDTGMPFTPGTDYSFEIDVKPTTRSWDVTISDGTLSQTMTNLGFRTSAFSARGNLQFGGRISSTGETHVHAIDSLQIVPEPGALVLLATAFACMLIPGRRRRCVR